jgi:hypothetical protein
MSDTKPTTTNRTSARRGCSRGCLVFFVLALFAGFAGFILIYRSCNPYDQIDVTISNLPDGVSRVYLLADRREGIEALRIYELDYGSVYVRDPYRDAALVSSGVYTDWVRWIESSRLGVLCRSENNEWLVAWFNPPKNRARGGNFVTGGGHWTVSWNSADEVQPISKDQLRAMGFAKYLDNN